MPLLDQFYPPLHGPRRWEGFHHAWATFLAQQLNCETLPEGYFAESEISLGPELEIDMATMEHRTSGQADAATAVWAPPQADVSVEVDFAHLETCEVRVYQDLGGAELRAAIELVSPANKDRALSRQTFAVKCAGYLRNGVGLVVVDAVTNRSGNLYGEIMQMLQAPPNDAAFDPESGLYAVAYRPVPIRSRPCVEAWPRSLALNEELPVMPLWLSVDLCVPVRFEESYQLTCQSLRISA